MDKQIISGSPLSEVADLYESANWVGIITTPSATLTLDKLDSFNNAIKKINYTDQSDIIKEILLNFFNILKFTVMPIPIL